MRIKRLKIKNFRSFGEIETTIELDELTAFIGMNSSGKTAVLHALLKLFGRSESVRELKRTDFHVPKGQNPDSLKERDLYIEAIIDFPELVTNDDTAKSTIPPIFHQMIANEPGATPYLRLRLDAKWKKGNTPEGSVDVKYSFIKIPEGKEDESLEEHKSPVLGSHRELIEIIYVPAIRNPASQLRNASGTILWRVLNGINWPDDIDGQIKSNNADLDGILKQVNGFKRRFPK